MPKKILHVTNFFKSSWESGGPARLAYEISKQLLDDGYDVTVFTTDGYKTRLKVRTNVPLEVDGITTYYFKNLSRYITRTLAIPLPYYMPFKAVKIVRGSDAVIVHEHRTFMAFVTCAVSKHYGIPYVVFPDGDLLYTKGWLNAPKRLYDFAYGRNLLKNARKVVAQNQHEFEQCKRFDVKEGDILYMPLGINISDFTGLPPRGFLRKRFSIRDDEKIILFLGRIHRYKGIELLVRTYRSLVETNPGYRLIIVGSDDGYLGELKALIASLGLEEKIVLSGPLYDGERIAAYVDADVFVLTPSHYEETSLASLEACASGTPVIVTRYNEIPGLLEYEGGFVIDYDQDELQDAVRKILSDDSLRDRMGRNARRLIEGEFDLSALVKRLENSF